jgi:hypothetical protein
VHEFEAAQVQRQPLLRDPPPRTQPRAQEQPGAFQRVDVDLAEPIPVFIPGELPGGRNGFAFATADVSAFLDSDDEVARVAAESASW